MRMLLLLAVIAVGTRAYNPRILGQHRNSLSQNDCITKQRMRGPRMSVSSDTEDESISRNYPTQSVSPLKVSFSTGNSQGKNDMWAKSKDRPIGTRKRDIALALIQSNWLILGEIIVIALAKTWPHIGATGGPLRPEITISKLAVFIIFFINGIALSIKGSPSELQNSFKTNSLIQFFGFGFLPLLASFLAPLYPDQVFRDGLLILSVLPCTINICVAQTLSAGGNMGTAIFNAIFGNVLGVFLCPLLTISILGKTGGISLLATLKKLGSIVILPLILGQVGHPYRYTYPYPCTNSPRHI